MIILEFMENKILLEMQLQNVNEVARLNGTQVDVSYMILSVHFLVHYIIYFV